MRKSTEPGGEPRALGSKPLPTKPTGQLSPSQVKRAPLQKPITTSQDGGVGNSTFAGAPAD